MPCRQLLPGAATIVTPAVRQRQHAAADALGPLDGHHEFTAWPLDHCGVGQSELGGIFGVNLQCASIRATGQRRQVVHPAVVGPQVPPPDQHQAIASMSQRVAQSGRVGNQRRRRQLDQTRGGAKQVGQPRPQRAQIDAVRG